MGPAGAASLAQTINAALANRERFEAMKDFFDGVGEGDAAGVWREQPKDRAKFKDKNRRKRLAAERRASTLDEAVGC